MHTIYRKDQNEKHDIIAFYRQIGDDLIEIKQQRFFSEKTQSRSCQIWIEKVKTESHHLLSIEGLQESNDAEFTNAIVNVIDFLKKEFRK